MDNKLDQFRNWSKCLLFDWSGSFWKSNGKWWSIIKWPGQKGQLQAMKKRKSHVLDTVQWMDEICGRLDKNVVCVCTIRVLIIDCMFRVIYHRAEAKPKTQSIFWRPAVINLASVCVCVCLYLRNEVLFDCAKQKMFHDEFFTHKHNLLVTQNDRIILKIHNVYGKNKSQRARFFWKWKKSEREKKTIIDRKKNHPFCVMT